MLHCTGTCAHARVYGMYDAWGGCAHMQHCMGKCAHAHGVLVVHREGMHTCNKARAPVHIHVVC